MKFKKKRKKEKKKKKLLDPVKIKFIDYFSFY